MTPAEKELYGSGEEALYRHLMEEYSRMAHEAADACLRERRPLHAWRETAWWVMHPRWRPRLWQLYDGRLGGSLLTTGPQYQEALLGIGVLTRSAYAAPRLTLDPQDCLPFRIRARQLTVREMLAR